MANLVISDGILVTLSIFGDKIHNNVWYSPRQKRVLLIIKIFLLLIFAHLKINLWVRSWFYFKRRVYSQVRANFRSVICDNIKKLCISSKIPTIFVRNLDSSRLCQKKADLLNCWNKSSHFENVEWNTMVYKIVLKHDF